MWQLDTQSLTKFYFVQNKENGLLHQVISAADHFWYTVKSCGFDWNNCFLRFANFARSISVLNGFLPGAILDEILWFLDGTATCIMENH